MHTEELDEPAVACTPGVFTKDERSRHDAELVATVLGRALERRELPDGQELTYPPDTAIARALIAWVLDERRCCPFLSFELRLESGEDRLRLALRGPAGTVDVLNAAFAAALDG